MRHFTFFILLSLFSLACQETIHPGNPQKEATLFFDLISFFKQERMELANLKSFKKTVSINGVAEEKTLDELDFDNELSIFIASDINRPAWSDKYAIDSVFTNQQLTELNYIALDKKLKTQKLSIDFQNNAVATISVEKATDNAVAQSKQQLNYAVGKGYTIQSEQALSLSKTNTIIVKVDYLIHSN